MMQSLTFSNQKFTWVLSACFDNAAGLKYFCRIHIILHKLILIPLFTFFYLQASAQDSGISQQPKFDSSKSLSKDSAGKDSPASRSALTEITFSETDTSFLSKYTGSADCTVVVNHAADSQYLPGKNDTVSRSAVLPQQVKPASLGMQGALRNFEDRDLVFYILVFLLFLLGLIRSSFPKYFNSVFSLSFQATFRQSQTREQMAQNSIPAFTLNVLFILSGGLFITLFAEFNKWTKIPFLQLFVYSTSILAVIYLVKYFVIRFTGWVFNAADAAAEYRFIVFLINKLIGIFFIPLLFLIAYADGDIEKISITIALCLAIFLLALRYLVSLARIRKNLSITAFHFFIYLCAVEIMPLLVIYKILFLRTGNT
jgi:hypothetical protein